MSMMMRLFAAPLIALCIAAPAAADTASARGMASVQYAGKKVQASDKERALAAGKFNAVERYIAEYSPAKQRLFDQARDRLMASIDSYVLGATVLSETDDARLKTYSLVVRVDLNAGRLENALADATSTTPSHAGSDIAVVFISRARTSVQNFDAKVYKRVDVEAKGSANANSYRTTTESERIGSSSIGTGDKVAESDSYAASSSVAMTTGGSTLRKADKVEWSIADSSNVDQAMTAAFTDAGLNLVPAEYIERLDLAAIRSDFAQGDDLAPANLRAMASAVKVAGIPYLTLGTMDVEMPDTDPVTGNVRVYVTVNARLLDLRGGFPRPLSAMGPVQYAGLGPTESVARTEALKRASQEVAKTLVDKLAVKGVR